ncbi:MAG: DUF547 domain-containing protein [Rhodoferax sp.]|uniref:DUF547 domain-containing protein n=1 Tax=Rhodoferax sp. TaxID=50421 RepID=UPI001B62137C|nr:DUF547 domain-containing protein [Rhodoferax sp.]MBP9905358.1 DUF547 domain-containing protein [Rhodoferax sp.]
MLKRLFFALMVLAGQAGGVRAEGPDSAAWDGLLKKHVRTLRNGQASAVDYAGLKTDRAALQAYLASGAKVSRTEFDGWGNPVQLAFLINSYNAWTLELVLTAYPGVRSIKDLGSFLQSPWKKRFIPLLGETRSLDDIEHGLIRGSGRYNDPRIHFAVNCASIGCPALRAEAYVPERLSAQLDDAAQKFLSDRTRNRLESEALKVSSIFKWYRSDFEQGWRGAHTLGQFLALYSGALALTADRLGPLAVGKLDISFLDYDWQLNDIRHAVPVLQR